jgi:hypothetical protein
MFTTKLTENIWSTQVRNPSGKLILLALARYANKKCICWPSIETLSGDTLISERQIMRIIKQLEADKLISVYRAGWNKPNVYTIHCDTMSPEPSIDYYNIVNG